MSQPRKPRMGVVGVGYLGTFHAQKLKNNPHCELIAVFDTHTDAAAKVARELQVQSFNTLEEFIGKVDAVTIAASTQAHHDLALFFLNNGIHVNVEKPLAATAAQGEAIVKLARQKKLKLATGHIERFNPYLMALKKLIKKPLHINLERRGGFKMRGADVSVLHDLMIHDIDLMFWLTGSEVDTYEFSETSIITDDSDIASLQVRLKNNCQVHIFVSRVAPATLRTVEVVEQGRLIVADSGSARLWELTKHPEHSLELQTIEHEVHKHDALQMEEDAFVKAIIEDSEPLVTGEDGLKALKFIDELLGR
ncbi:MAG: Gfo/Idh/MocA family oxidoreductase [Bdellovibrionota bacterium]